MFCIFECHVLNCNLAAYGFLHWIFFSVFVLQTDGTSSCVHPVSQLFGNAGDAGWSRPELVYLHLLRPFCQALVSLQRAV